MAGRRGHHGAEKLTPLAGQRKRMRVVAMGATLACAQRSRSPKVSVIMEEAVSGGISQTTAIQP